MLRKNMKKAVSLVMMVILIVLAGMIASYVTFLATSQLGYGVKSLGSELAFYSSDSGIARGKQLAADSQDCSWIPDPPGYLQESYHVPAGGAQVINFKIYCTQVGQEINIDVLGNNE
ncbi:MAG: hypothetical protein ABH858_06360 [Candidatus Omnitrophota bacterium]